MNSDKRMAELYLERDAGKKHLIKIDDIWKDRRNLDRDFESICEYKLKPETLDEFIHEFTIKYKLTGSFTTITAMKEAIKWAWANPESKE